MSAATWKAETLMALTHTQSFRTHRTRDSSELHKNLNSQLRRWTKLSSRAGDELKDKIIEPAIDLHSAFKCSRQEYELRHPPSLARNELDSNPKNDGHSRTSLFGER